MPRRDRTRARHAAAVLLTLVATVVATVGLGAAALTGANAAVIGTLAVNPPTGVTNISTISTGPTFTTSAPCPAEATNTITRISGGNIPADTLAVGNTPIQNPGGPETTTLLGTWEDWADVVGAPKPISGTVTVNLLCTSIFGLDNYGEFETTIVFTPVAGSTTTSNYVAATGPSPSPTLPPGETPTPTPTLPPGETPTPTPAPTETPLPTETPAPTETPLPTETPAPTETPLPTETPFPTETPLPTDIPPADDVSGDGGSGDSGDSGDLAQTGAEVATSGLLGTALLAGGTLLALAARRRRRS